MKTTGSKSPSTNEGSIFDPEYRKRMTKGFNKEQLKAFDDEIQRLKEQNYDLQKKKDDAYLEKKEKETERHNNTKIPLTLENFRPLFYDIPNKTRLEIIKSLIWSSNDQEEMWQLVKDKIIDSKFNETLD